MTERALRTEIAAWLEDNGLTNEWLADYLGGHVKARSVQHWVSGRREIPARYRDHIRMLMLMGPQERDHG